MKVEWRPLPQFSTSPWEYSLASWIALPWKSVFLSCHILFKKFNVLLRAQDRRISLMCPWWMLMHETAQHMLHGEANSEVNFHQDHLYRNISQTLMRSIPPCLSSRSSRQQYIYFRFHLDTNTCSPNMHTVSNWHIRPNYMFFITYKIIL